VTTTLFLTLLTILSVISSLFTEALKKTLPKKFSSTLLVLIVAIVVGWGGCAIAYILMGIPFTVVTVTSLVIMAPAVWLGATLGYDKVMEVVKQITGL
jgi:hypothetical protein